MFFGTFTSKITSLRQDSYEESQDVPRKAESSRAHLLGMR